MNTSKLSKLANEKSFHYALVFTLLLFFSATVNAQKNMIGIYGSGEWGQGYGLRNISGLTYERKFTNHFGLETGLQLHTLKHTTVFKADGKAGGIRRYYTNAPVLFKYYSNIINVAAGPTLNMFTTAGRFGNHNFYFDNNSVPPQKNLTVGYLIKVSKAFNIKDQFVLEPEVNLGNRFEFKKPGVGIGASFKYKF